MKMKTISFYSYKGGVGRSLALAYTAKYLAEHNIGVCVLDIDLEAPGVINKFISEFSKEEQESIYSTLGIVDYVNSYNKGIIPDDIEKFFSTVYEKNQYGYIKVMGAGKGIYTDRYWDNLNNIDWKKLFSGELEGLDIFNILKYQIEKQIKPDYILIDSRAGVTKMGIVCTSVLPDTVIMCLANNTENFKGSAMMYHHIKNSKSWKLDNTETDIICAITRFPTDDDISFGKQLREFNDTNRKENKIINEFYNAVAHHSLKENDIFPIHSNREIEREERLILENKLFGGRMTLKDDYNKIIDRLFKEDDEKLLLEERNNLNKNEPRYHFILFDLNEIIENELKKHQGDMLFEDFWDEIKNRLTETPNSYELLYKDALCKRYKNNIAGSVMSLFSVIDNAKDDAELKKNAHYWRGVMFLYDLHNYKESIKDLEIVYATDNFFNSRICYDLALCYYCLSDLNQAIEYTERYMSDKKDDYRAFLLRANINMDRDIKEQKGNIIHDFNEAIKRNDTFADSYNCRGTFYYTLDDHENAHKDFDKGIEIDSDYEREKQNKYLYRNRGNLFFKLGELSNAIKDYNKAIEIDTKYEEAYEKKGDIYASIGKMTNALEEYEKIYKINPNYKLAHERQLKPDEYYKTLEVYLPYDFQYSYYDKNSETICIFNEFETKYHLTEEIFEFIVIKNKPDGEERIILSDQGRTLKMLEKEFELKEFDVTKNFANILKEFRVFKNGLDLSIEIIKLSQKDEKEKALEEAKYRLFRCVSFINKMHIFYNSKVVTPDESKFIIFDDSNSPKPKPIKPIKRYSFPAKYCKLDLEYAFVLVEKNGKYYITDQGNTYEMLDIVFAFTEDVIKNLHAIMEIFKVSQIEKEFLIEINTWDINSETEEEKEIKHRLLECVSFMNTMRIFYRE